MVDVAGPVLLSRREAGTLLERIALLEDERARKLGLDLLALTGAGWVGSHLVQGLAARRFRLSPGCDVEPQLGFGDWADDVWETSCRHYTVVANRDRNSLETLFGGNAFPGLIFLKMTRARKDIGWAAVLDTAMSGHPQFGNLRVGTIVDGFPRPMTHRRSSRRDRILGAERGRPDRLQPGPSSLDPGAQGLRLLAGAFELRPGVIEAPCGENPVL